VAIHSISHKAPKDRTGVSPKHCTLTFNVKAGGLVRLSTEMLARKVCDAAKPAPAPTNPAGTECAAASEKV
jgi:hypothetical protein